jgi:EmrB/QacA subfamily drug resistance transporter
VLQFENLRIGRSRTARISEAAPSRPFVIAFIVGCALFMQTLDSTIVATALPKMAQSLDENPVSMSVVITSYLLTLTVAIPISGWLADRYGARAVFLWAIAIFTASSLMCGLAPSLPSLVVARLVQGAAGAMMAPVGRTLILRSAAKSELIEAMSYLAVPALVAPVLGPPIGGFIVVHASWRWIFLMNAPIGIISFVAAALVIKAGPARQSTPLDVKGFLLSSAGLASLIFGLEASSRPAPSQVTTAMLLIFGSLSSVAYVLHARKHSHAILNLALFKISTFTISVVGGILCRLSLGALPFLLTLLLQIGFGLDAFQAGMIAFTTAIGSVIVKFAISLLVRRLGFRRVLIGNSLLGGSLIMCCALIQPSASHTLIAVILFGIGFLRSLQLTVANTLGYADVPESLVAGASSMATTAQYLAIAAGVGIAAVIVRISATFSETPQLTNHDTDVGFIVIGALFVCSSMLFARLPRDAGADLIGARP